MNESDRLSEILWRAQEFDKQLAERARLYALLGSDEIAEEFERLRTVELGAILKLASGEPGAPAGESDR